jgi:hypothetical protein
VAGEEEHSCRRAYIVLAVAAALALMSAAPTFACSSNFYSTSETTSENKQGSSAYPSAWSHEASTLGESTSDTDNTEDALCIVLFLLMPLLGKLFTAPKAPRKPKGIYDWALERPG